MEAYGETDTSVRVPFGLPYMTPVRRIDSIEVEANRGSLCNVGSTCNGVVDDDQFNSDD